MGSSVFGKNSFRFWEKHAPFFGKKLVPFLGKTCTVFGTKWLRFWEKAGRFGGENWLGLWIGLGQSLSLTVLNAKHVWVWIFEVLGLGVTKNKSTGGKLEG